MKNYSETATHYLISTVAKRSGVKADLIRAWERRYQAVTPTRTEGGHRVYSDLDIARLKSLHQATTLGHSISQIAKLSLEELQKLLTTENPDQQTLTSYLSLNQETDYRLVTEDYIAKCYTAMLQFDVKAIEAHFENAVVELGAQQFIEKLLTPLLKKMGDDWENGQLRPAHEHVTTAVIRSMVYVLRSNYIAAVDAPKIVISTPSGQHHELGALLAALVAEFKNWHIIYLGPNLPAEEIAFTAKSSKANAVALGITVSLEGHLVARELRRLKKLLGPEIPLIVGGKAAEDYRGVIEEIGAIRVASCDEFKIILDDLATQAFSVEM